jgi:hypothetical protein
MFFCSKRGKKNIFPLFCSFSFLFWIISPVSKKVTLTVMAPLFYGKGWKGRGCFYNSACDSPIKNQRRTMTDSALMCVC